MVAVPHTNFDPTRPGQTIEDQKARCFGGGDVETVKIEGIGYYPVLSTCL